MRFSDSKKKLHEFRYPFSEDLIALKPNKLRDESKLMVINRTTEKIEHKHYKDILDYVSKDDVIVLNDSKIFPGMLEGKKEKKDDDIRIFLLRELDKDSKLWDIIVDPARKIRIGNNIFFGENNELVAEVIDNTFSRGRTIRFQYDGTYNEFISFVRHLGRVPLPSYIFSKRDLVSEDTERYQNVFAKNEGAMLAPSAGFGFSKELLLKAELNDINIAYITLHLGLHNLVPLKVEDINKHKTDSEEMVVSTDATQIINKAKASGKKVIAIGTSTVKALESAVGTKSTLYEYNGWSHKFIFPPYNFEICDAMVTGFHLPETQMFLMTAAFCGLDLLQEAYRQAINKKYKFMAYGDAMLII